jgi:hypothetical protein
MRKYSLALFLFFCYGLSAQEVVVDSLLSSVPTVEDGDYYREDQIYINFSSIRAFDIEDNLRQVGLSYSYAFGYMRDIPLNKKGTLALGVGLGYNRSRIKLTYDKASPFNDLNSDISFDYLFESKVVLNTLQIPLEIRWRNSTATKYRFWRMYAGFTFNLLLRDKVEITRNLVTENYSNTGLFRDWEVGPHMSVGYGIWNFHIYYSINNLFAKDAQRRYSGFETNYLKLGLQFFIF